MTNAGPYRFRGNVQPVNGIRASVLEPTTTDGGTAVLRLYDPIDSWGGDWGVSAREFAQSLEALPEDTEQIELHLNSPGGEVWEAIAILNQLRNHRARVVAVVDGIAASAASFLAAGLDEVVMGRNATVMVHDAWSLAIGNAADMRDAADRLDKISDNIASIYAAKAGGTTAEWREIMRDEPWYSAEEAVAAGLADRVSGAEKSPGESDAKARFDLTMFAHAGRSEAPAPKLPERTGPTAAHASATKPPAEPVETINPTNEGADAMSETIINGLRERLGIKADAEITEDSLMAALDEALEERADAPTTTDQAPTPGTVNLDEETYRALREDAAAGRQARDQQVAAAREATVQAAIDSGRIPPARREHWVNMLAADPGAEETLNSLEPGTVPLTPKGYTGGVDEATDEDRNYSKFWPTNQTKED